MRSIIRKNLFIDFAVKPFEFIWNFSFQNVALAPIMQNKVTKSKVSIQQWLFEDLKMLYQAVVLLFVILAFTDSLLQKL